MPPFPLTLTLLQGKRFLSSPRSWHFSPSCAVSAKVLLQPAFSSKQLATELQRVHRKPCLTPLGPGQITAVCPEGCSCCFFWAAGETGRSETQRLRWTVIRTEAEWPELLLIGGRCRHTGLKAHLHVLLLVEHLTRPCKVHSHAAGNEWQRRTALCSVDVVESFIPVEILHIRPDWEELFLSLCSLVTPSPSLSLCLSLLLLSHSLPPSCTVLPLLPAFQPLAAPPHTHTLTQSVNWSMYTCSYMISYGWLVLALILFDGWLNLVRRTNRALAGGRRYSIKSSHHIFTTSLHSR